MLVKVFGGAVHGVNAQKITIEVNVDNGVGYHLVGLPDNAIKESSYRISAALKNVGYKMPGKKITINMAPADLRKEGSAYDLSIAMGILAASEQIDAPNIGDYIIMGELSLDGGLQPIKGILPIAIKAKEVASNRRTTCELIAAACGKPVETVMQDCSRVKYLQPHEAVEYGLIDQVIENGSKSLPVKPAFMSQLGQ